MSTTTTQTDKLRLLSMQAKEEIGESDLEVNSAISKLKNILTEHYPKVRLPNNFDQFLLRCLRVRKFDIARSAKLVSHYFKLLGELSDMHSCLLPSLYRDLYTTFATAVLKYRDVKGRTVILTRQELVSPAVYTFDEAFAATLLLMNEVVQCNVDTQRLGIVFVCDWKGYSVAHFKQTSPSRLRTAAKLFQDAFPARLMAFHFIRNPFLIGCMFAIVKPFLRDKIRNRVFFHGYNFTSLHEHVEADILPMFLGGTLPNDEYTDTELTTQLLERDTYYKELLAHSYKE